MAATLLPFSVAKKKESPVKVSSTGVMMVT